MKKPDLVVWNETEGYYARSSEYPTNVSSPNFSITKKELQNSDIKKMFDTFEAEKNELVEKFENLVNEFNDSLMVWNSKISFVPIVGRTYYLYNINSNKVLSIISPKEWNKYESFLGAFKLNSENKWKKI